jgi:peptidoglycan hydrolase-like protein with peptidoglycan-binding domain
VYLAQTGYLETDPTGYFGNATKKAVQVFQRANGIAPQGNVGPATRAKIKELSCNGPVAQQPVPTTPTNPVMCTMEMVQCPDGSYSGRSGPNCETSCPKPVTPTPVTQKTYTTTEVALHSTRSDCWITMAGSVYDVSSYISMHPGGSVVITNQCGKDAAIAFNTKGYGSSHSPAAISLLSQFLIGKIGTAVPVTPTPVTVALARTAGFAPASLPANTPSVKIGSFTMQNTSAETVQVSSATVDLAFTGGLSISNFTNLSLRDNVTSLGVPLGSLSGASNNFSFALVTIPAYSTKTFDVYADIGGAVSGSVKVEMTMAYYGTINSVYGKSSVSTNTGITIPTAPVLSATSFAQVVNPQEDTVSCIALKTSRLSYGMNDGQTQGEVTKLQTFLKESGYLSKSIRTTGSFGPATRSAVKALQRDVLSDVSVEDIDSNIITSLSERQALAFSGFRINNTGTVGMYTRAKIAFLSCGGKVVDDSIPTPICPAFAPPAPDFCKGGTITPPKTDANGCILPPSCKMPTPSTTKRIAIYPTSGPVGTKVLIQEDVPMFATGGAGTAGTVVSSPNPDINVYSQIYFDGSLVGRGILGADLSFSVPDITSSQNCSVGVQPYCTAVARQVTLGIHSIYINNKDGTSNSVDFKVTGGSVPADLCPDGTPRNIFVVGPSTGCEGHMGTTATSTLIQGTLRSSDGRPVGYNCGDPSRNDYTTFTPISGTVKIYNEPCKSKLGGKFWVTCPSGLSSVNDRNSPIAIDDFNGKTISCSVPVVDLCPDGTPRNIFVVGPSTGCEGHTTPPVTYCPDGTPRPTTVFGPGNACEGHMTPPVTYCPDGTPRNIFVVGPSTGCEGHEGTATSIPTLTWPKSSITQGEYLSGVISGGDVNNIYGCMDSPNTVSGKGCTNGVGWRKLGGTGDEWVIQGNKIVLTNLSTAGYPVGKYTGYQRVGPSGTISVGSSFTIVPSTSSIPTCADPQAYYYYYNGDVKAAYADGSHDAKYHWNNYGWKEGRKSCWTTHPIAVNSQASQVLGAFTSNTSCTDIPRNLIRGSESSYVTLLQDFLYNNGFLNESSTGFYGDKTVEAVKDYQATRGLPTTGMVYDFTRQAIYTDTCQ